MSRKTNTVLTLRVQVSVPTGSNAAAVMNCIRDTLRVDRGLLRGLDVGSITVSLLKKETTYA